MAVMAVKKTVLASIHRAPPRGSERVATTGEDRTGMGDHNTKNHPRASAENAGLPCARRINTKEL